MNKYIYLILKKTKLTQELLGWQILKTFSNEMKRNTSSEQTALDELIQNNRKEAMTLEREIKSNQKVVYGELPKAKSTMDYSLSKIAKFVQDSLTYLDNSAKTSLDGLTDFLPVEITESYNGQADSASDKATRELNKATVKASKVSIAGSPIVWARLKTNIEHYINLMNCG